MPLALLCWVIVGCAVAGVHPLQSGEGRVASEGRELASEAQAVLMGLERLALFDGGAPVAMLVLLASLAYASVWFLFWIALREPPAQIASASRPPARRRDPYLLFGALLGGQLLGLLPGLLDGSGLADSTLVSAWLELGLDGHFMLLAMPAAFLGLALPCWGLDLRWWSKRRCVRWSSLWFCGLMLLLVGRAADNLLVGSLGNPVLPQAWLPLAVRVGSQVGLLYAGLATFLLFFAFLAVEHLRPRIALPLQIIFAASAYVLLLGANHPVSAVATGCLVVALGRAGAPTPVRALAVLGQVYAIVGLSLLPVGP